MTLDCRRSKFYIQLLLRGTPCASRMRVLGFPHPTADTPTAGSDAADPRMSTLGKVRGLPSPGKGCAGPEGDDASGQSPTSWRARR